MTNLKIKSVAAFFVYVAIALLAISDTGVQLLILNTIGEHSRILRQIAIWLLFSKVIMTHYTKKEFLLLFPVAVLSLYNYTICGNIYCIWNILIIAALKDIDLTKLFQILFFSTFTTLVVIGILSFWDIGGAIKLQENFGRERIETRYCFGLHHPNIWHYAFARSIVYFILGFGKHLKWPHYLLLFIINFIAYKFSVSRTGLLTISLFIVMMFAYQYWKNFMHTKFMKLATFSGLSGIVILYLYVMYDVLFIKSSWGYLFNRYFCNSRISQAFLVFQETPIRFWGSRFIDDGTVFDFGILRMIYESGLLLGIFAVIVFLVLFVCALKNEWDSITATCIFIFFYSLYEAHPPTRPTYNLVVFFVGILLYSKNHTYDIFHKKIPEN